MKTKPTFSQYEIFLIIILTIVQFTVVLDFAVLVPLGTQLMRELDINVQDFGILVSSYAIAAGVSGLIVSAFSDLFDRRKFLLWMYVGFIMGTIGCGIAWNYETLLLARVVAGIFGGIISGILWAVITDVFEFKVRGRVMGFIQMAFAGSQILGIPLGLYLAQTWSWHLPFYLIAIMSIISLFLLFIYMKPLTLHLQIKKRISFIHNTMNVFKNKRYLLVFSATFFLATGGYILMPFSTPFLVNNLGVKEMELTMLFFVAGLATLIFSPLLGYWSDQIGSFKLLVIGSLVAIPLILIYTDIQEGHLIYIVTIFTAMTVAVSSRMITSSAIITAIPAQHERGAFMNINSSIQHLSGGAASLLGAAVLRQNVDLSLANFSTLGYWTVISMVICIIIFYWIQKTINKTNS